MPQLIAGNWKMHLLSAEAEALARAIAPAQTRADLLLCPPFLVLPAVGRVLAGSRAMLGGQDCHPKPQGAHTGDIAAPMLRDAGASWVIVGHSERRHGHGETDALVRAKAEAAQQAGLQAIVCVGETAAQHETGDTHAVLHGQLEASLPEQPPGAVAYEPVWAIGTGKTPTEDGLAATHLHIRRILAQRYGAAGESLRILYGGSVKGSNARSILAIPHVGGALVGGASLDAAEFLAIADAAC